MITAIIVVIILSILIGFAYVIHLVHDAKSRRVVNQANIMLELNEAMQHKDVDALKRIIVLNAHDLDRDVKKKVKLKINDLVIEQNNET